MFDFLKRRPAFLIVGAQKAGTSALEFFLSQHPRIQCARKKEVGFFNRDKYYERGEGWYARQFPLRGRPGVMLFEATPSYIYYPVALERIFRFDPRMKLVVLLRNPADRAYSAWNMFRLFHGDARVKAEVIREFIEDANPDVRGPMLELLNRPEFPAFDRCVRTEIEAIGSGGPQVVEPSFVRRGLYAEQVERLYRRFPRENVLILESGGLKRDRVGTLNRVLQFLGLPALDWDGTDLQDKHVRPYEEKMADATRFLLQEFYEPHNARLYSIVGQDYNW